MKISLDEAQIKEAVKLYAIMVTGMDLKTSSVTFTDGYSSNVYPKLASVEVAKPPVVPMPSKGKKEISQEDIDKVYASIVDRKLDIS